MTTPLPINRFSSQPTTVASEYTTSGTSACRASSRATPIRAARSGPHSGKQALHSFKLALVAVVRLPDRHLLVQSRSVGLLSQIGLSFNPLINIQNCTGSRVMN